MGLMPTYRIVANQADITATVASRFVSMRITDETGLESDTLEIVLADHDPLAPIAIPSPGAEIEVFLGYDGAAQRMGLFVCDEIEASGWPAQMTIRGRAAPYAKSSAGKTDLQTQKTRSWPANTKLADMVAKIAKEHSMEPAVSQSLQSVVLSQWDQTAESDLSFLIRVGRRYDAIVKAAGGKLVVAKRGESKTTSGEALPVITITPVMVTSYSMTTSTKEAKGTVVAFWHNKKTAKRVQVQVGDGEPVRQLRHNYPSEDAAKSAAQAELDKRVRGETKLAITLPGDPALCAEGKIDLAGFRPGIGGEWLVTSVEHSLDTGTGYACSVSGERERQADNDNSSGGQAAAA